MCEGHGGTGEAHRRREVAGQVVAGVNGTRYTVVADLWKVKSKLQQKCFRNEKSKSYNEISALTESSVLQSLVRTCVLKFTKWTPPTHFLR